MQLVTHGGLGSADSSIETRCIRAGGTIESNRREWLLSRPLWPDRQGGGSHAPPKEAYSEFRRPGALVLALAVALVIVPRVAAQTPCFPDVEGHWAETFICWLQTNGIVSGYPDGTYRPDNNVTRGELAVYIQRVHNLRGQPPLGIGTTTPGTFLHVSSGESGDPYTNLNPTTAIYGESAAPGCAGVRGSTSGGFAGVVGTSFNSTGGYFASGYGTSLNVEGSYNYALIQGNDFAAGGNTRFIVERATGNVKADGAFTSPADFAELMTTSGAPPD